MGSRLWVSPTMGKEVFFTVDNARIAIVLTKVTNAIDAMLLALWGDFIGKMLACGISKRPVYPLNPATA